MLCDGRAFMRTAAIRLISQQSLQITGRGQLSKSTSQQLSLAGQSRVVEARILDAVAACKRSWAPNVLARSSCPSSACWMACQCTDLTTKRWVQEAGVDVLNQPIFARGNVATAGGCLASLYLAVLDHRPPGGR